MDALGDVERGQYMFPYCKDPQQMKDPEWVKKRDAGPAGMVYVLPRGPMKMAPMMATSMAFNLVVSLVTAYVPSPST